jgi:hypothetical protein
VTTNPAQQRSGFFGNWDDSYNAGKVGDENADTNGQYRYLRF